MIVRFTFVHSLYILHFTLTCFRCLRVKLMEKKKKTTCVHVYNGHIILICMLPVVQPHLIKRYHKVFYNVRPFYKKVENVLVAKLFLNLELRYSTLVRTIYKNL